MHVDVEGLVAALRERGFRVTRPRRAVCSVIAVHHDEHLTAPQILAYSEEQLGGGVDRATVYRTLEALEEAGVLRHSHIGHGPTVYHLTDERPHQHLVCGTCGKTVAVGETDIETVFARITEVTGFVPDVQHFALGGLCAECAERD